MDREKFSQSKNKRKPYHLQPDRNPEIYLPPVVSIGMSVSRAKPRFNICRISPLGYIPNKQLDPNYECYIQNDQWNDQWGQSPIPLPVSR
ncbi:MAG: hypothetical protein ABFS39_19490 [Pseudomonadota bacterium]